MKLTNCLPRELLRCLDFTHRKRKTISNTHCKRKTIFNTVHEERWSKLADDVMQLILQQLCMSDSLRCRNVCRSWRTTIDSKRCLPAYQLPWLLLDPCCSYYFKDGCFVSDGKLYESRKDRTHWINRGLADHVCSTFII